MQTSGQDDYTNNLSFTVLVCSRLLGADNALLYMALARQNTKAGVESKCWLIAAGINAETTEGLWSSKTVMLHICLASQRHCKLQSRRAAKRDNKAMWKLSMCKNFSQDPESCLGVACIEHLTAWSPSMCSIYNKMLKGLRTYMYATHAAKMLETIRVWRTSLKIWKWQSM